MVETESLRAKNLDNVLQKQKLRIKTCVLYCLVVVFEHVRLQS